MVLRKVLILMWGLGMSTQNRKIVAVVDDDVIIRNILDEMLAPKGYELRMWPNYDSAFQSRNLRRCDFYICDMVMNEGEGGVDAIPRIKAANPNAVVIAITAGMMSTMSGPVLALARKMGADKCIKKPLDIDEVVNALESGHVENT